MIPFDQLNVLSTPILRLYDKFMWSVILDIVRRLNNKDIFSAAWQVQRLIESGYLREDILKKINSRLLLEDSDLEKLFTKAGVVSHVFDKKLYAMAGMKALPLNLSPQAIEVLKAGLIKTQGAMRNLIATTATTGQEAFIAAGDLAYMQITSGAFSWESAVKAAIKTVAGKGIDVIHYSGHREKIDVAIRRAVLTGVGQTVGLITLAEMQLLGVGLVAVSAHIGARNKGEEPENHEMWQGQIYRIGDTGPKKYREFYKCTGYGTGEGLLGWNCILGDTLVSGSSIGAAYRRKYSGEIIVIRTAAGHELSITPNHPVLTKNGWVKASLLNCGDYVISRSTLNRDNSISPNINQKESSIENVFSSLSIGGDNLRFPASSGYFHGDISDDKIDVVFPKGFLRNRNNSSLFQQMKKFFFGNTRKFTNLLNSMCTLAKVYLCAFHSSDGIMSRLRDGLPSFYPTSGQSGFHSIRSVLCGNSKMRKSITNAPLRTPKMNSEGTFSGTGFIKRKKLGFIEAESFFNTKFFNGIPCFGEPFSYNLGRASEMPRNVTFPHSADIQIDKVIFIDRKLVSSVHVYNLHTALDWYFSNGIITHNCRHTFFPFFEGVSENAYSKLMLKEYADKNVEYNGKTISWYEASQKQRAIERAIRKAKREAAALGEVGIPNLAERQKVRILQAKMRDLINQTGLDRQYGREQIIQKIIKVDESNAPDVQFRNEILRETE